MPIPSTIQEALFERYADNASWNSLSRKYDLHASKLRRAYRSWFKAMPDSQPLSASDIHLPPATAGRRCSLHEDEEKTLLEAVMYFANNHTPLTRSFMADLVQHYVQLLPESRREDIAFRDNRPSAQWVTSFISRHDLAYKAVRIIEDKRVDAVTEKHITEHVARLRAAYKRYNIRHGDFVLNMDQSGISFAKMVGRSLRKGIRSSSQNLTQKAIRTKGNLERVTVMPVVSASRNTYTPVVVYPGIEAHYRRVRGQAQTVQHFLPKCYFYQREVPGVDSRIIYDWAQKFLEDTADLRKNSQYILLLIDGYGAHVQFHTLQLLRENRVIVIAMPAHTSHCLQPLDVSVFSAYKSYVQKEIHGFATRKNILDAFDIAICIRDAYSASHTTANIISGFYRSGAWDEQLLDATIEPLRWLFHVSDIEENKENVTLDMLLESYSRKERSLLRDADVEEKGTIRIKTTSGCNLTSEAVIDALQKREDKIKRVANNKIEIEKVKRDYKEPKADIRHLVFLSAERKIRRKLLDESRSERRFDQKLRVKRNLLQKYESSQGPLGVLEDNTSED